MASDLVTLPQIVAHIENGSTCPVLEYSEPQRVSLQSIKCSRPSLVALLRLRHGSWTAADWVFKAFPLLGLGSWGVEGSGQSHGRLNPQSWTPKSSTKDDDAPFRQLTTPVVHASGSALIMVCILFFLSRVWGTWFVWHYRIIGQAQQISFAVVPNDQVTRL